MHVVYKKSYTASLSSSIFLLKLLVWICCSNPMLFLVPKFESCILVA